MTIRPIRWSRGLAAMVLLCAGWVAAGPAEVTSAALLPTAILPSIDLLCIGSAQVYFSPPLDNNTVSGTDTGLIESCSSPDRRAPQIRSAVLFGTQGNASGCFPLGFTLKGTGTFSWSDGTTTNFTLQVGTNLAKGPIEFAAVFNAGTLAGDRIMVLPLIIDQDGLCGFGGVRNFSFPLVVVVITH